MSSLDLGRLMFHNTQKIDYSVTHLRNRGLIKIVEADGIVHYFPSEGLRCSRKKIREIAINDKIEGAIIQIVRESLQQLFPDALATERERASGSHDRRHFDIFLEFKTPVMSKQFISVDVYANIPVTEYIVQSFIRKIRFTRNETGPSGEEAENARYPLRGKTLGMIICTNASQEAVDAARKHDISLLSFMDIHIDLNQIRKKVTLTYNVN